MRKRLIGVLLAAGCVAAVPVHAHHSFAAEFDPSKTFKMTGVVTKVEWTNPHAFFYIDVVDEKTGKVVNWAMEMGSPNSLMREGWSRTTMKMGDRVIVEGVMARDGAPLGNTRAVIMAATGKRLFAASSATQ